MAKTERVATTMEERIVDVASVDVVDGSIVDAGGSKCGEEEKRGREKSKSTCVILLEYGCPG
jgi:hypothetical protein